MLHPITPLTQIAVAAVKMCRNARVIPYSNNARVPSSNLLPLPKMALCDVMLSQNSYPIRNKTP